MGRYLSMGPDGVRLQARSFTDAGLALNLAGQSKPTLDPGALGKDYTRQAQSIRDGLEHVSKVIADWSAACTAFGTALNHAADAVQNSDTQVSGDLSKVSFDGDGDLTMGGGK